VDSAALLTDVVQRLNEQPITPVQLQVVKAIVNVEKDQFVAMQSSLGKTVATLRAGTHNLLDTVAHLLQFTQPPVRMTRMTLQHILSGLNDVRRREALANPQEFASVTVRLLRAALNAQLVDGIRYERIDDYYEMSQFEAEFESWQDYLQPAQHAAYDHVVVDSETERRFAIELEKSLLVKAYIKLPDWFTIPTPLGTYNPDWAIVTEDDERLYFVAETKGSTDSASLRESERRKIECGKRHFAEFPEVQFKVVTTVKQLLNG
jgi:type III restriction enzyme